VGRDLGPLHGIPYAAKDLFDVRGVPTTGGTHLLASNVARGDSAAVRRLSQAGMALLGKNHTIQFAYGMTGINTDQGTPRNPWTREPHAPGGSSSGGAVAVAAGLVPAALGTDTGGSVRAPASLCGIVGLKTTVGRVSRAGVYPLSGTYDSVGPLTRTVRDAAIVAQALQGADPLDPSTANVEPDDLMRGLEDGVQGLRLAFGETLFFDDVDPEVANAVREAGALLRGLGARVDGMVVPEVAEAWDVEKRGLLVAAEACVNNRALLEEHSDELDPRVVRRMIPGRTLEPSDYQELLRRFAALRESVTRTLRHVDALIVPTTMDPARPLAPLLAEWDAFLDYNTRLHRNCGLGNLLGLCGLSVPCGFTTKGLPIGLMIYAKPFHEGMVLRVGHAYEQATEWSRRRPDLDWARPAPSSSAT
jgi:aspartyl-tRNA(Asn)/glutamyl-tRNA(Gln) amidotransferase subunit A